MWINNLINIDKTNIGDISTLIISPKNFSDKLPVIFFYHGWSSNKDVHKNLGSFLACNGYMVVIPDSINHGERGTLDYWQGDSGLTKFWPTILNSVKEFNTILDYVKNNYNIDEYRIGVCGHSMGGMITSGIIAHNKCIKAGVIMNSSGAWVEATLEIIGDQYKENKDFIDKSLNELSHFSPINNIDNFNNTPLLLLHGDKDALVPIKSEITFFNSIKDHYENKNLVDMKTYDRLNHYITEAMVTEGLQWFNTYL
ncbi:MAG: alpha/beta fold hydrolase [Clostridium sp.]